MAKVKITKNDITTGNVEMPDGYKISKFKTHQEIIDELRLEADRLEAELGDEPSNEELVEHGMMNHPYYQTLNEIEYLRKQL